MQNAPFLETCTTNFIQKARIYESMSILVRERC